MNKSRKKQCGANWFVLLCTSRWPETRRKKCRNVAEVATEVWEIQGRLSISTTEIDRALRHMFITGEVIQHGHS